MFPLPERAIVNNLNVLHTLMSKHTELQLFFLELKCSHCIHVVLQVAFPAMIICYSADFLHVGLPTPFSIIAT